MEEIMINNQSWQGYYFYFSSGGLPMGWYLFIFWS